MKVAQKVIVVTGAGSGMGRALTLQLLARGAAVAAVDINQTTLAETARLAAGLGQKLSVHQVDISDREQVYALPQAVIAQHGKVDGIINNAGIIQPFVRVNDLDYEAIARVMHINFYGTLYMVKAFLPHLLLRPQAHIANVSSMGGFIPVPGQTIYGASKAAVKLLTEGLYSELTGTTVRVTLLLPGAVDTHIMENSGLQARSPENTEGKARKVLSAEDAARIMIEAIERDRYSTLVGPDARFLDRFYRLSPARAARMIASKMQDLLAG